jgi:uncharacterized membrane protein YqaE (UPF0057 family)
MNGDKCNITSDCKNDALCTMTYADKEKKIPLGRFCSGGTDPLGEIETCRVDNDCPLGNCEVIRTKDGQFLRRQCMKDGKPVRKGDYEDVNPGFKKYFYNRSVNMNRINGMIEERKAGPIAKIIVQLISLGIDIVKQIISLGVNIFWLTFEAIATVFGVHHLKGDVITGLITKNNKKDGLCFSMWLIRNIFTIILPPFGVFMTVGFADFNRLKRVLLCCLLTSMFYFPGLIYALILVNNNELNKEEQKYVKCLRERKQVKNTYVSKFEELKNILSDPQKTYEAIT